MPSHGSNSPANRTYRVGDVWRREWGDPLKLKPAAKGYDWLPIRNKAGKTVGWKYVRDKSEDKGGGPASSNTGGGGGGGYGYPSAPKGLSAYIQAYRGMFDSTSVNPPKDLLKKAEKGNWSIAYWNMQVRLNDKNYLKSAEAKKNLAELVVYWRAVLPGTKVNRSFANEYLRHGWSATQLQNKIMQLPNAKKQYPFWAAFLKAQRAQGAAKLTNPQAYKAYAAGFADVYKQAGQEAPQGYEKLFFRSGLSDEEFVKNYAMLAQTKNAAQWDVGGLSEQQKQAGLFDGKGAGQVRGLLQIALNKQARYMGAAPSSFRVAEDSGLVTLRGI